MSNQLFYDLLLNKKQVGGFSKMFCREGSKTPIIQDIIKAMPSNVNVMIDPFVGSGIVTFKMIENNMPFDKYVINDLDKKLMSAFRLLKNNLNEDKMPTPPYGKDFRYTDLSDKQVNTLTNWFERLEKKPNKTNEEKLAYYIASSCGRFQGTFKGKIYRYEVGNKFKQKNLDEYKEMMDKITIYNEDYKKVIRRYINNPNAWFFIDPPYEESKGLYVDYVIDFNELNELLKKVKGKFLLTLNDSPNIRKIFNRWNIRGIKVKSKRANLLTDETKKIRNELFITNY